MPGPPNLPYVQNPLIPGVSNAGVPNPMQQLALLGLTNPQALAARAAEAGAKPPAMDALGAGLQGLGRISQPVAPDPRGGVSGAQPAPGMQVSSGPGSMQQVMEMFLKQRAANSNPTLSALMGGR